MASGSMSLPKLNMVSYAFYLQLVLYSWVGSVLVVYNIDHHYSITNISDQSIRFYGWLSVMYTMVFVPIGILISKLFFTKKILLNYFDCFLQKKLETSLSENDSYLKIYLYLLSFISLFTYVYLLFYIKEVGLYKMFTSADPLKMLIFRIDSSRNFQGNQYLINVFGLALTPVLAYISYGYYMISKSNNDKLWCVLMFLLSVLFLTYNLEKGPLITFVLGYVFVYVLINGGIKKRTLVYLSIILLVVLIVFYLFITNEVDIFKLFSYNSGIGGRILLSQLSGFYECLAIYPQQHDFLGFTSISKPISNLVGIDFNERAARINMMIIYPEAVKNGIVGVGNTLFIGEAWANFGLLGILLSPIYVGVWIGTIYNYIIIRSKKTPIVLGIYAYLSVFGSMTGGFNDYIYSPVLLIILMILYLILSAGFTLKKYLNEY
ncbi:O-antigen polymerase [Acetobacteroides hydrogenigenes]|uniref:Oligosaccharide repeat unit polymerase n=1 Tax=Acetobacteroides hydrogenigenes TaxID=979970 RepID=A0A4R2E3M1_9BACT|nr:O-antigen polymerase [Acetobacteroides hydrogenigenes]TCN62201.1 oligosaccharide repeat unit polymerase [Acetobacteroides hydrogenigenes]